MADVEPVVMTLTEVIRHNLKTLRDQTGMSRREVADYITARTGDTSWNQYKVYDIEGRKGRDRVISPEELLTLAVTYDVSMVELMTPPESVYTNDDVRPVLVSIGRDNVSPELFFRLAFLLGPEFRKLMGEHAHHGRDKSTGRVAEATSTHHVAAAYAEAAQALVPDDTRFEDWITDEDNVVALIAWVTEQYGSEVAWKLGSERMRAAIMEGEEE